jgi:hypothetical protein
VSRLAEHWIDLCYEEGVCHVCGKTVLYGHDQPGVYTITGAHYDCEFPNGRNADLESLTSLAKKLGLAENKYAHLPSTPQLAWANGGSLLHWVIPNKNRALCGHQPKDNAWRMKQRGKWLFLKDGADVTDRKFCQKCLEKHAELYPEKTS